MGKQKQIGLEKFLKFDGVKILAKHLSVRTLKLELMKTKTLHQPGAT